MSTSAELFDQAWQYHQANQFQEAEQLYRQVLQTDPNHADAWCFLGSIYQGAGKIDDALACFQRALEQVPSYETALNCMGIVLAQQGKLNESAASFERALGYHAANAEIWNNLGLVRLQQGQNQAAVACFQRVLQLQPDYPAARAHLTDLLQSLASPTGARGAAVAAPGPQASIDSFMREGIALARQGRMDEAGVLFAEAVRLWPDSVDAHNNLGGVLFSQQRYREAIACYEQALRLNPHNAEARYNLGVALENDGRMAEAAASYEHALQLNPRHVDAWNNLGYVRKKSNDLDRAVACYEQAVRLSPDRVELHLNLSLAHGERGDWHLAEASCREAQRCAPDNKDVYNGLGIALTKQRRPGEAVGYFQRAVEIDPNFADAWNHMGIALKDQGRFAEAITCYQRALAIRPNDSQSHTNWGNVLQEQGSLDEALAHYELALQLAPEPAEPAESHFNRAILWLLRGDWERGWKEYEWRWRTNAFPHYGYVQPRWDGSDLTGKTIFLYAEQGLGDTIQFIRYAPMVKQRGGTVILQCQAVLQSLLGRCAGIDHVIPQGSLVPDFRCHAALLSLPGIFGTTVETVPANIPYLSADKRRVEQWRAQLPADGRLRVGIVWQGRSGYQKDRLRSVPLAQFMPLAQVPGVALFSLQVGEGSEQLASAGQPVTDLGSRFDPNTLEDLAAVLTNLDLLVTVDTAPAHLAGALGVPVWVAIPRIPDWRWQLEGAATPWYPTMRLFRQSETADWLPVFERITAALRELAQAKGTKAT